MGMDHHEVRDLALLEEIERDPDTTQASMAARLGVAVGTVNWHIKRLVAKGYVKVKRAERRKLRYLITPEGLALRATLTVNYIENSMVLFRQTRQKTTRALEKAREKGFESVLIKGDGDLAEVCRLTCIEHGFHVLEDSDDGQYAILEIQGRKISFVEPEKGI